MTIKQIPLFEFLILAVVVSVLTTATAWVYPIWDDLYLQVLIGQLGDEAIRRALDSRVLLSHVFIFLSHHGLLLSVGLVLHWLSWFGMGLVTFRFWQITFPAHADLALLPAILAVSPVLCKVQFIVMCVVAIDVIEPVLVFAGILLLLTESRQRIQVIAGGLLLVVVACLLSEYGVATAAVGCVLLFGKSLRETGARRRELRILTLLLGACGLASYVVFSILARSAASPAYKASFALQSTSEIHLIPFRLISGMWRGLLGAYLESIGSITVYGKAPLVSFLSGAVLSTLVTVAVCRRKTDGLRADRNWPTALTLFVATVVGVLPFLLMSRTLESYWDSRFWLPALPVVSSLTVYLLLSLIRERLWILVAICCGFVAGYWTSTEIFRTYKNREQQLVVRTSK